MKSSVSSISAILLTCATAAHADPILTSWLTGNSTKYARVYTSVANRNAGISTTTWGTQQTSPTYCGVHEINYSPNWVYIKNSGLAPYVMGPWNNPNLPKNQGTNTAVYRFPRTPTVILGTGVAGRTLTGMGSIGFLVDGVSLYNTSDGFSYSVGNAKDATPNGMIGAGDGIWNRDAWPNEGGSFDYALNHPQPSGQYHAHGNPIGVRYVIGDNVNYSTSSKQYSENTATTTFTHSPIIGWVNDGLPLYGPYGYDGGSTGATAVANLTGSSVGSVSVTAGGTLYQSVPAVTFSGGGGMGAAATAVLTGGVVTSVIVTNPGSGYTSAPVVTIGGVRRMISGYVLRDGNYNTTNLNSTGRTTLPQWAKDAQNRQTPLTSGQYGPTTTYTTTNPNLDYTLGHYSEDYDYLGDLGFVQGTTTTVGSYTALFDLNKFNARFCVTPEFPNGTWAYFVTIKADGTPWYPYNVGRWFMATPPPYNAMPPTPGNLTTVTVMNADTPLTQYFKGSTYAVERWSSSPIGTSGGNVTISWNAVEGGTYQVQATSNLATGFAPLTPTVTATGNTASATENGAASSPPRFYKVTRTGIATYDSNGY